MTDYVMVPVPEEFVDDVTRYVQWTINSAERPDVGEQKIVEAVQSLDEACRALLSFVVDSVLNGRDATIPALAAMLGCGQREVLGTMLETNQRMRVAGAPVALMPQKAPGADTFEPKDQIILVAEAAARAVAAALLVGPGAPAPDA